MPGQINLFKGAYSVKNAPPENPQPAVVQVEDALSPEARSRIVTETMEDFERRRLARQPFELKWRINQNFIAGNQFVDADFETGRLYGRDVDAPQDVYNKMAPIYEARVAKLANIRPLPVTRPATGEGLSVLQSQLTTKLLNSTYYECGLGRQIGKAIIWSELAGTAFYKVSWNPYKGRKLGVLSATGEEVFEGGVETVAVSPFEIYPDYSTNEEMADVRSIIHAQALPVDVVNETWNVNLSPESTWVQDVMGADIRNSFRNMVSIRETNDFVLVIEKFEVPTKYYPSGRHIVAAQNTLLYYGALPYLIGEGGKPGLPFVKQVSERMPGYFWGRSVQERLIPIQRQYNRVRNDITNIISRFGNGVLDVPDGSYDEEELQEGMYAGKILHRRPGMERLSILEQPDVPGSLVNEVNRLENDFTSVSGVSEYSVYSQAGANASGAQLDMLSKSDDSRLRPSGDSIREAITEIARMWIRLYRQFATGLRVARAIGDDNTAVLSMWESADLTTDDVVLDTRTDLQLTPEDRKKTLVELLQYGLFANPRTGKIDDAMRTRLLKEFELQENSPVDTIQHQSLQRAQNENFAMRNGEQPFVKPDDDDGIHIDEHVKFELSQDIDVLALKNPDLLKWVLLHIEEHRLSMMEKQKRELRDQQEVASSVQAPQGGMPPGMAG